MTAVGNSRETAAPQPRLLQALRLSGHDRGRSAGRAAPALIVAGAAAAPILAILTQSLAPSGGLWSHLAQTVLADYVLNTLALLLIVATLTLIAGAASAWMVTMYDFPGRAVLRWALLLPLAMPAYVPAYAYTDFFQFTGPLQTWLRAVMGWGRDDYWFPNVHSLGGAGFVLSAVLYPYVYVLARSAFLDQSVCVLEAGRTLGAAPLGRFFRVALPLARPALAAGVGYALMETLADFGAVRHFGVDTFTVGIYRAWFALASPVVAAQLSASLLAFVLAVLALERLSRGGRRFHATTTRRRPLTPTPLPPAGALLAWGICVPPIVFGFLLPAGILLAMLARGGSENTLERAATLTANSLFLAAAGGLLVVALAILVLHGVRAGRSRLAALAMRVASLGYAAPGAVIAVGVLLAIGAAERAVGGFAQAWFGWSAGLILGGTLFGVLYGYLVRFFAVACGPLEAGFARISPNLEGAARSLGRRPVEVLIQVHAPLLRASILSAFLLVFVDIMKELPATMILRPFNFDTLAIEAFRMATTERLDEAALPSLLIVAAGLAPVILLSRSIGLAGTDHGRAAPPPPERSEAD